MIILLTSIFVPSIIQPKNLVAGTSSLDGESPSVLINLTPGSIVYEGDIVNCTVTGDPHDMFWMINRQSPHYTFYGHDPILFDPEPTPLNATYVNLSVWAVSDQFASYDTVQIKLKRLYFGDIQFHSTLSDGYNDPDTLYSNAIVDNYLDFACLTDHAEIVNEIDHTPPQPLWMFARCVLQYLRYKFTSYDEWQIIKDTTQEYYQPGRFTTLLGFEYSPGPWYPGGHLWSEHGWEDVGHVCFYYKDVYADAPEYSAGDQYTFDDVFQAMADEWDKGHYNIGFPHHPLMKIGSWGEYTVNWSFLASGMEHPEARNQILRGVETYSKWGSAIGIYSGYPMIWPYESKSMVDHPSYWVENGLWEWSKHPLKNQRFALIASSDNHAVDRPGSASMESRVAKSHPNPAGIIAAYAVHNTRSEIWDALNTCDVYGTQALKIRANIRFDDHLANGRWINCTSPLSIQIAAQSTFPGVDSSGRSMKPHGYSADELEYPISDIWVLKKDTDKGQPWCKVLAHLTPNTNLVVATIEDADVQPNDFYYVVIRQHGQDMELAQDSETHRDQYTAFIGPVYIDQVTS